MTEELDDEPSGTSKDVDEERVGPIIDPPRAALHWFFRYPLVVVLGVALAGAAFYALRRLGY